MARFHVTLGSGEKITMEADAVDNVPEFVREIKDKSCKRPVNPPCL